MKRKKGKLSKCTVRLLVGGLALLGLNSCVSKKAMQQMQNTIEQQKAQIDSMDTELNSLRQTVAEQDATIRQLRLRDDIGRQKLLYGGPNTRFRKVEGPIIEKNEEQ